MSKNVALFTVINGEPTRVGTCHPGQARILKKEGKAEWKDGKLWLAPAMPEMTITETREIEKVYDKYGIAELIPGEVRTEVVYHGRRDREYLKKDGVELVGVVSANPDAIRASHQAEEVFNEIDPDRALRGKYRRDYTEKMYPTAEAFYLSLSLRVKDGHNMWPVDEPKRLMVGYIDDDTNEHMLLRLSALKNITEEEYSDLGGSFGLTGEQFRDSLKTSEGRSKLVGADTWDSMVDSALEDMPAHLKEELFGARESLTQPSQDMWDRGHKQETMEAFGDHLPISKRLTVASKKVHERQDIRKNHEIPAGWAAFQWPRDRIRIEVLDNQGKPMGPPEEPWSVGAYLRKARRLVRVYKLEDQVVWDAAEMVFVWETIEKDPDTGEEKIIKLDVPGTGVYRAISDTPRQVDSLEAAYAAASEWVRG